MQIKQFTVHYSCIFLHFLDVFPLCPLSFGSTESLGWCSSLLFPFRLRFWCVDCLWIDLFIPMLYLVSVYTSLVTSSSADVSEALSVETWAASLPHHLLSVRGCFSRFTFSVTFFIPSMYWYSIYRLYIFLSHVEGSISTSPIFECFSVSFWLHSHRKVGQ